jgi:DNA-binding GntR family transcriptional regulator
MFDKALEISYNIKYRISRMREKKGSSAMPTLVNSSSYVITYGHVQDAVVDGIRDMILKGYLKPGDRLRQDELADTFGVSTMPIREALRQLQAEGLVIFRPRRGATVASLSVSEYEEIYRIREELEILACRWAAEDFERIPIDRLKLLLEEIEAAEADFDDVHRRMQLVREFFFTMFEASEKEHLLRILSSLWDLTQQYRRYFSSIPEIVPRRLANYRDAYRACEARDPERLVGAIRAIYAFGKSTLIALVREEEGKKQTK